MILDNEGGNSKAAAQIVKKKAVNRAEPGDGDAEHEILCTDEAGHAAKAQDARGTGPGGALSLFDFEKHPFSSRTIWRVFWGANNYATPDPVPKIKTRIEYWYGEEGKERQGRTTGAIP